MITLRQTCLLLLVLGVSACQAPTSSPPSDTIRVSDAMSGQPDPGFARADRPIAFNFPQDHGPHPDYATEWWYFTGNLYDQQQRRFGYQLTLFRIGLQPDQPIQDSDWRATQLYMGHLAISDIQAQQHHSRERLSRAAAGLAGGQIQPLRIWLGPWSIQSSQADQLFPLRLQASQADLAIDLTLQSGHKPMLLQGESGWSKKSADPGNASYYYSYTRLPTQGLLQIGEQHYQVSGNSWFDREWSSSALAEDQSGWDWFSLQLDDGRELMFYQLRDLQGHPQSFSQGVLVDQSGESQRLDLTSLRLEPVEYWSNPDGTRYPIVWHMTLPDFALELTIKASIADQEMRHSVHYWEGAVDVSGSHTGVGYLELSGYAQ